MSRRRTVVPWAERTFLRAELMGRYYEDHQYQAIVRRYLGGLWDRLVRSRVLEADLLQHPKRGTTEEWLVPPDTPDALVARLRRPIILFDALARAYERELTDERAGQGGRPDLRVYMEALRRTVAEKMRLTKAGQPAAWALAGVHNDVIDAPFDIYRKIGNYDDGPWERSSLDIHLSPLIAQLRLVTNYETDASFELGSLGGETGSIKETRTYTDSTISKMLVGWRKPLGFDDWEALEEVACALLRGEIERMRTAYQDRYRRANVAGLKNQERNLTALFHFLFHREPLAPNTRRRLYDLVDKIGIDLPKPKRR